MLLGVLLSFHMFFCYCNFQGVLVFLHWIFNFYFKKMLTRAYYVSMSTWLLCHLGNECNITQWPFYHVFGDAIIPYSFWHGVWQHMMIGLSSVVIYFYFLISLARKNAWLSYLFFIFQFQSLFFWFLIIILIYFIKILFVFNLVL